MSATTALKWALDLPRPSLVQLRHWRLAAGIALISLFAVAWHQQLFGVAYYWVRMQQAAAGGQPTGVWLPRYRATIDALRVEGIFANASGLTFNRLTGTLFAVINNPPQIAELSTEGELLRLIPLRGVRDPEDIAHIGGELFAIADERDQQIILARVTPNVAEVDLGSAPRLGVGIDLNGNKGFEGVAWDPERRRLLVVKEKFPLRVIEITGLLEALGGGPFNVQITEWEQGRFNGPFLRDLSSIAFHEPSGNLLLLSDESRLLVEYDPSRTPVSMLDLRSGQHGLAQDVPQAEGAAVGPDGTLYLLSEPNLFYRFQPI